VTEVSVWADECSSSCDGTVEVSKVFEECVDDTDCTEVGRTVVFRDRLFSVNNSPSTPDLARYPWSCSRTGLHAWKVTVTRDLFDGAGPQLIGTAGGGFVIPGCTSYSPFRGSKGRAQAAAAGYYARRPDYVSSTRCRSARRHRLATRWVCAVGHNTSYHSCRTTIVVKFKARRIFGKRIVKSSTKAGRSRCRAV
jgi:hypothetical protein